MVKKSICAVLTVIFIVSSFSLLCFAEDATEDNYIGIKSTSSYYLLSRNKYQDQTYSSWFRSTTNDSNNVPYVYATSPYSSPDRVSLSAYWFQYLNTDVGNNVSFLPDTVYHFQIECDFRFDTIPSNSNVWGTFNGASVKQYFTDNFCLAVYPAYDSNGLNVLHFDDYASDYRVSCRLIQISTTSNNVTTYDYRGHIYYDVAVKTKSDIASNLNTFGFALDGFTLSDLLLPSQYNVTMAGFGLQSFRTVGYYAEGGTIENEGSNDVGDIVQGQKDAADYALDKEEQANQSAVDDGLDNEQALQQAFNITDLTNAFTSLYNSITYTGTDGDMFLPASGNIPYVGQLWDRQQIPFRQFFDQLPSVAVVVYRVIFWVCCGFGIFFTLKRLLYLINGNRGDD